MIDEKRLYAAIFQVVRWTVGGVLGGVVVLLAEANSVPTRAIAAAGVLFLVGVGIEYGILVNEEMMESDGETSRESS